MNPMTFLLNHWGKIMTHTETTRESAQRLEQASRYLASLARAMREATDEEGRKEISNSRERNVPAPLRSPKHMNENGVMDESVDRRFKRAAPYGKARAGCRKEIWGTGPLALRCVA